MLSQFQIDRAYQRGRAIGMSDDEIQKQIMSRQQMDAQTPAEVKGVSTTLPQTPQQNAVGLSPDVANNMNKPLLNRVVNAAGDIFMPTVKKMGLEIDTNRRMSPAISAANKEIDTAQVAVGQLLDQALKETDPNKKKQLLKQVQDIDASLQSNTKNLSTMGMSESGMSQQDLANLSTNPIPTALNQGIGAAGEVGSWFTPTGQAAKNANYGQKVLQGAKAGAKVGFVRGVTKPTEDPLSFSQRGINTAIDTGVGAGTGAAMQAVLNTPEAIKNLGQGTKNLGDKTIQSQYNLPRSVAKSNDVRGTVSKLADYGISNIDDIESVSPKVTGSNGAITKIQREVLGKTKESIDLAGVMDMADELASDPLIPKGQDSKFVNFVKKAIGKSLGKSGGAADMTNAGAFEAFEAAQALEKQAYAFGGRNIQLTPNEQALKSAYLQIASEIKTRLYEKTDNVAIQEIIKQNPKLIQQLYDISPELANDVFNSKTISELRSVAAPFVRGGIMTDVTNAGADLSVANWGGSVKGVGKMIQNPLNLAAVPLSSNTVNAGAGQFLHNAGEVMSQTPTLNAAGPVGSWFSGQASGRMFTSPSPNQTNTVENQSQYNNGSPDNYQNGDYGQSQTNQNTSNQVQSITGFTPQQLGQAYTKALMAGDSKAASQIKQMYDMETSYQKQQKSDELSATVKTKIAAVKTAENILDEIGTKADSLNLGNQGLFSRAGGVINKYKAEAGMAPEVYNYNNYIQQVKVALAKAMGQVGNMSAQEQQAAVALIENAPYMTKNEFQQGLIDLKNIFKNYENNLLMTSGQMSPSFSNGDVAFQ